MAQANISGSTNVFANALFSDDSFADDEQTLTHAEVAKFVVSIVSNAWNHHHSKWVKADKGGLDKQHQTVEALWAGNAISNGFQSCTNYACSHRYLEQQPIPQETDVFHCPTGQANGQTHRVFRCCHY